MAGFTNNERTDMIILYGEALGNEREAIRLYGTRFPDRRQPSRRAILNMVTNLRQHGSFLRQARVRRAERVVANQATVENVLALVAQNPHISSRAAAREVGCSHWTVLAILHANKFHPYKIHLHQALKPEDLHRRIEFCLYMQEKIAEDDQFLARILWSDESTFHRDGTVNRHNCHYWSQENPHWLREQVHQVRWKTNVWAGIFGDVIIGPYFFEGDLNAHVYLDFLRGVVTNALDDLPLAATRNMWFQQDGAPPHFGLAVREWLDATFAQRWIGRGGPFPWPPRSPDLTPLDFFLWGYVKSLVYETEPGDLQDLKHRIRQAFAKITPQMLAAVRCSITERLEDCLTQEGGHFEHLY